MSSHRLRPGGQARQWGIHWQRRYIAPASFLVGSLIAITFVGIPSGTDVVYPWAVVGILSFSVGDPDGALRRVLRDWIPFMVILVAYDSLRGSAGHLLAVNFMPQVDVDRWLFGGQIPTVTLQRALWHGHAVWWDLFPWAVYLSHFLATPLLAAILWKTNHDRFVWFKGRVVALSFAGLATYALYPAAPPWLAAKDHLIAPINRLIPEFWSLIPFGGAGTVFESGEKFSNDVAAVPSLHAAFSLLISCTLWPLVGRRWRPLLVAYPLAMAFTVVFTGEHYVSDVLLGWAYTGGVLVAYRALIQVRESRSARREPALADSPA